MTTDLRDRSREILRAELAESAADYCATRGFDAVTVDEIAQHIGVSRATFFRYFATKEEAVIVAVRNGRAALADGLRSQPAGLTAMQAVRAAVEPSVEAVRADPDRLRARLRLIATIDGLRARLSLDRAANREALAAAIAERGVEPRSAQAVAGAAMAAIDLAWLAWAADPGTDIGAEFDEAFRLVSAAGSVVLER